MIKRTILPLILSMLLLVGMTACAAPEPAGLSDEQVGAVLENILAALDNDDYEAFIRDFSPAMLEAFSPEQFTQMRDLLQGASGNFVSLGDFTLVNSQGYAAYLYQCQYEQEKVVVRLVFAVGGTQVEGLFFDSTNLRAANK